MLSLFVAGLIVAGTVSMAAPPEPAQAQETPEYDGTVVRTDGVDGFITSQGNPAVNSRVWDIEIIGGTAYVGGKFTTVVRALDGWKRVDQPFLAAFDTASGRWVPTFRPVIDGPVWALEQGPNGQLYVGGEFTKVNGQARSALVALDPATGATDPAFLVEVERPDAEKYAIVRDFDRRGNDLYVIGNFSKARAGSTVFEAAKALKVDATTGAINQKWQPVLAGRSGWAIVVSTDGRWVHLGGEFTYVNGAARTSLYATVDAANGRLKSRHRNGSLAPPRGPWHLGGIVYDLEVSGPWVFMAGAEHYWAVRSSQTGQPVGPGLQKGSLTNSTLINDTQVVENLDGRIVIGCHCIRRFGFADLVVDGVTGEMLQEITLDSVDGGEGLWAAAIDNQKCYWYGGDIRGSRKVKGREGKLVWTGNFIKLCPTSLTSTVPPDDLAVNGTASQIATAFSGAASRAIDGNTDGVYRNGSVAHTPVRQQPWWEVDLGADYQISRVRVHNRTDCCSSRLSDFVVMISSTPMVGRDFTALVADPTIKKIDVDSLNDQSLVALDTDSPGRYVRVQRKGSGFLALAEVEVFGQKSVPVTTVPSDNVAVNGTASQIATDFKGVASRAIDGNTSGVNSDRSIAHTPELQQPWWEVDLGADYQITKVRVHNRTDCCESRLSNFVIMISPTPMEGRTFKALVADRTIKRIDVDSLNGQSFVSFPTDLPGRYVRVQLKGSGFLSLAEVEVFGARESASTLVTSGADWTVSTDRVWPDNWHAKAKPVGGTWAPAKTRFGYGDGDEQTVIDSGSRPLAVVARSTFDVGDPAAYKYLTLKVAADDGATIWINGNAVAALRMPNGVIKPSTLATENVWGKAEREFTEFLIPSSHLVKGANTIAASVHQGWPSSRDLAFDLQLMGETATPPRALDSAPAITVGSSDVQLRAASDSFVYYDGPGAPAATWTQEAYDDTAWKPATGTAGVGEADIDTQMPPDRLSYYVRADVPIGNVTGLSATVNVTRDDGIIVYVNGQEIGRDNMPAGPVDENTLAPRLVWGSAERDVVSFAVPNGLLKVGNNVIAAEIHQGHADSKDSRVSISVAGSQ